MAKEYVWDLKRPTVQERRVVLSDKEGNPGKRFELTVRRHDAMSIVEAYTKGEEYVLDHVTGRGEPGKAGWTPPINLPPVGGEPLAVTPGACRVIAVVESAQVGPDKYEFAEIAAMCSVPAIAAQVARLASELQPGETGALEDETDPLGPTTAPSSGSPSSGPGSTPRSSNGQTPSYAPSTIGSEPSPEPTAAL